MKLAMLSLLAGSSVTAAAAYAGVRRETVSRWMHHHAPFRRALRDRLSRFQDEIAVDLAVHARRALQCLAEGLDSQNLGTRLRVARDILRLGPLSLRARAGTPAEES